MAWDEAWLARRPSRYNSLHYPNYKRPCKRRKEKAPGGGGLAGQLI
jgi:hypothetical protein